MYDSVTELIGGTPLVKLNGYAAANALNATIAAKLEYFNPAGSVKDRIAKAMIEQAEKTGNLRPGGTIIEPTSGNTGIGLAAVAAAKGYRLIVTMPENMSVERRNIIKAYGAEIVLTDADRCMDGAIKKAYGLAAEIDGAFVAGQFENPANPAAHYASTGPEIWRDTDGKADALVCAVGTGGTLSGTGAYLKDKNSGIKIIAVEPYGSPVLSGGKAGPHGIQGIGAGFVPATLNTEIYDEVLTVTEDQAYAAAKELARTEGILVGISSGAALHAATALARRPEYVGKLIVVILPDSADRYYSTPLFG